MYVHTIDSKRIFALIYFPVPMISPSGFFAVNDILS